MRANWDAAVQLARVKEEKIEVDGACQQNATDTEERTTERDEEEIRGARNEGSRTELGSDRKAGSGQHHDGVPLCRARTKWIK